MIKLYKQKKECCNCTACINICPKHAIITTKDIYGFIYPIVKNQLCVQCGLCKEVCDFQKTSDKLYEPIATFAAINKNNLVLEASASGGVFVALSSIVLKKNGIVFGCAFNHQMEPEHIYIDNQTDIKKLQGSKYVQSNLKNTYVEVENYLKLGKLVLFTGTPCQVAGLKAYLRADYNNLFTADLICHGVPSAAFFQGYVTHLEAKLKGRIIDFKFRDKSNGWGVVCKVVYEKNFEVFERVIFPIMSSYVNYFLKGDIYRDSCYVCKYAGKNRPGDFTMGDYWGIEEAHPEIKNENGVSVLLVNSKKGMLLINELRDVLNLTESTFKQAMVQNKQLCHPTTPSNKREKILNVWHKFGYKAVADEYYKLNKMQIRLFQLKQFIPKSLKKLLKEFFKSNY